MKKVDLWSAINVIIMTHWHSATVNISKIHNIGYVVANKLNKWSIYLKENKVNLKTLYASSMDYAWLPCIWVWFKSRDKGL